MRIRGWLLQYCPSTKQICKLFLLFEIRPRYQIRKADEIQTIVMKPWIIGDQKDFPPRPAAMFSYQSIMVEKPNIAMTSLRKLLQDAEYCHGTMSRLGLLEDH